MPIFIDIDSALFKWQSTHHQRLTYSELAMRAGLSLPTLNRFKSGDVSKADLKKINQLCKVLECEPGDLLRRVATKTLSAPDDSAQEIQQMIRDLGETDDD